MNWLQEEREQDGWRGAEKWRSGEVEERRRRGVEEWVKDTLTYGHPTLHKNGPRAREMEDNCSD